MQDQLNEDLQEKYPDHTHHKITNWRELRKWHESFEGVAEDEISWKRRKGPFDEKKKFVAVTKQFKIDSGIQHVYEKKKGFM